MVRYGGSTGAVQTDAASPTITDNLITNNSSYGVRAVNISAPNSNATGSWTTWAAHPAGKHIFTVDRKQRAVGQRRFCRLYGCHLLPESERKYRPIQRPQRRARGGDGDFNQTWTPTCLTWWTAR